jgi:hypothetical protein
LYNKDNKEIKREYLAIATYGWKTWGDNVPTVKLVVNSYGQSAEQNLTEEEVGQVIEMLQSALAEAKAAKDIDSNSESPWGVEEPF